MKRILCNKYEVLKPIAEGGMGEVLLVKDLHLNKLAAVKINRYVGTKEEQAVLKEAVVREREVLKRLSHPALPGIIDFFEEEGRSCLVMEYVEGITLEQYLRKFVRVEVTKAVKWAISLTRVLEYLHGQNPPVIYRDLKPANIMIQPDGELCLVDFGAAGSTFNGRKEAVSLWGTPGYVPPELWEGKEPGKTCDIYGIGAVLHEMLTGIRPGQSRGARRPIREYDRSLSGELQKIIMVCTAGKRTERYQSMEGLREALLHYEQKDRIKSRRFQRKKAVGMLLFLLAAGKGVLPLLQGVEADLFPFPYLRLPLFLFGIALCYERLFLHGKKGRQLVKRQEKSLFLSEKKFNGFYAALGILLCLLLIPLTGSVSFFPADAAEKPELLWVEMRDDSGRKLLLKEGDIYPAKTSVRFEIPAQELPQSTISLWLIAQGERGEEYKSRRFLVQAEGGKSVTG